MKMQIASLSLQAEERSLDMVEQKDFFDVFSGLTLNQDLMDLFAFVQIRKITQNSQKNAIRVYITCDRLITK